LNLCGTRQLAAFDRHLEVRLDDRVSGHQIIEARPVEEEKGAVLHRSHGRGTDPVLEQGFLAENNPPAVSQARNSSVPFSPGAADLHPSLEDQVEPVRLYARSKITAPEGNGPLLEFSADAAS